MRHPSLPRFLLCCAFAFLAGPERVGADEAISYSRQIAPILQRNCVACHREKQSEGGLSLESKKAMRTGRDSGDLLVAGSPDESLLYLRAADDDAPMPPEGNTVGAKRLTQSEMELVRNWILQGAEIDADGAAAMFDWQPIPESVRSSFAIASSPDNRFLAIGRANRVELLHPETGDTQLRLTDDALDQSGVADVDVIQAIGVSPLGDRIATGGFRTVRIWEPEPADVATPKAFAGAFGPAAVNPDRTQVALANPIGDVAVWDPDGDEARLLISGHGSVADINWEHAETIAVGLESGDIHVFSSSDGSSDAELKLDHPIDRIARSSDGRFMAVLGVRGQVRLFDQHTSQTLKAVDSLSDVSVIGFIAPTTLVAGTDSGEVLLVDPASDQLVHRFDHGVAVTCLAANQAGSVLATGGQDGQAKLWNTADATLIQTLRGDAKSDLLIASLGKDVQRETSWLESLKKKTESLNKLLEKEESALAKVKETREKALGELNEETKQRDQIASQIKQTRTEITAAKLTVQTSSRAISENEKLITQNQKRIETTKAALEPLEKQAASAMNEVQVAKAKVEEAMRLLASAEKSATQVGSKVAEKKAELEATERRRSEAAEKIDAAKTTKAESIKQLEGEEAKLKKQQEQLAATEKGVQAKQAELDKRDQALATAKTTRDRAATNLPKHDNKIRARDNRFVHLKRELQSLNEEVASSTAIAAMTFDDADERMVIVDQDGTVRTFNVANGKPLDRFEATRWPEITSSTTAASIGEGRIVINHRGGPATVMPTKRRWMLKRTIGGLDSDLIADRVTALDFASDGQTLAIGSGTPSRNGQVLLAAAGSGAVMRRFDEVHSDTVLCLRFSPDDRTICSASADKTIRLLDVDSGQVIRALDGHTHHVLSVAWKHDGRMIASGSADGTIKTWEVETGQQKRTIGGFPDEVTSLEFLGDSTQVVSSCADGQIRIHETGNGQQLRAASASGDFLFTVGVSPDGSQIFAAGQQGTVHVWQSGDLKAVASW